MKPEVVMTVADIVWGLVTLGFYLKYRLDMRTQDNAWRRIAEERRKQQAAWRVIRAREAALAHPDIESEIDAYLTDSSPYYYNPSGR